MKKFISIAVTSAVLALPTLAQAETTGSVALASDYPFRGISQTGEDPSLQGSLTYAHDFFYVGFWGSNVDFGEDSSVVDQGAQLELDVYAGINGKFGESGLGWDLSYLYYFYPGADGRLNYDYYEIIPKLTFPLIGESSGAVSVAYSPEFFGESGSAFYYNGTVTIPLPFLGMSLGGSVGLQTIDDEETFFVSGDDSQSEYLDWRIALTAPIADIVDFTVAYHDTDLEEEECFGGLDLCDARVVATVSKSF